MVRSRKIKEEEFDSQSPLGLRNVQEWFGGIISTRLDKSDKIQTYSNQGTLISKESARYVKPSPTLAPHLRMQIYNQQYWWRLLKILQDQFPLVTRLVGVQSFKERIATPYLVRHPPDNWHLNFLGVHLAEWIKNNYKKNDCLLIQDAAALDRAFTICFSAEKLPALDLLKVSESDPDVLLNCTFNLQPHIELIRLSYDLFKFRTQVIKLEEHEWLNKQDPPLPSAKQCYFILYQNDKNFLGWRELSHAEYLLLTTFKKGTTLAAACEMIENQEEKICEEMSLNLQKWLQEWAQKGWLTV